MSHFAFVNSKGIVEQVIVAEQDVIDTGLFGNPTGWVQTSYNTYGGVHKLGGTPLRKNYAGVGYTYDIIRDAFYLPKPYPSWKLDENTCLWNPPVAMPDDGKIYNWDEASLSWVEFVPPVVEEVVVEPISEITDTIISATASDTISFASANQTITMGTANDTITL